MQRRAGLFLLLSMVGGLALSGWMMSQIGETQQQAQQRAVEQFEQAIEILEGRTGRTMQGLTPTTTDPQQLASSDDAEDLKRLVRQLILLSRGMSPNHPGVPQRAARREQIQQALIESTSPQADPALIDGLNQARSFEMIPLLEVLARRRPAEAVFPLTKAYRRADATAEQAVLETLQAYETQTILDELTPYLKDDRSLDRFPAMQALGALAIPQAEDLYIRGLTQSASDYVKACQVGLVGIGQPVVDRLVSISKKGTKAQRPRVLPVLARIPTQKSMDALAAALAGGDPYLGHIAYQELSNYTRNALPIRMRSASTTDDDSARDLPTPGADLAVSALLPLVKHASAETRVRALQLLGRMDDPRIINPVLWRLYDDDRSVVRTAMAALARQEDPAAIPYLMNLLSSQDRWRRVSATQALRSLLDGRHRDKLRAMAASDTPAAPHAVDLLGHIGDKTPDPTVLQSLLSPDKQVSDRARYALSRCRLDEQESFLLSAADHAQPHVRANSARLLELLDSSRAVEKLCSLLSDSDLRVRQRAWRALRDTTNPKARQPLIDYVLTHKARNNSDASPYLGVILGSGLYRQARKDPAPFLTMLNHSSPKRRSLAARLLSEVDTEEVCQAMRRRVRAGDEAVVLAGYRMFGGSQADGLEENIIDVLMSHDDIVMAEFFLNSSNRKLRSAAKSWGRQRGYKVVWRPFPVIR